LKLKYDEPLANFAFEFNLRRHKEDPARRRHHIFDQSVFNAHPKVRRCKFNPSNPC
jgi:hypothetical protein